MLILHFAATKYILLDYQKYLDMFRYPICPKLLEYDKGRKIRKSTHCRNM